MFTYFKPRFYIRDGLVGWLVFFFKFPNIDVRTSLKKKKRPFSEITIISDTNGSLEDVVA